MLKLSKCKYIKRETTASPVRDRMQGEILAKIETRQGFLRFSVSNANPFTGTSRSLRHVRNVTRRSCCENDKERHHAILREGNAEPQRTSALPPPEVTSPTASEGLT